MLRSAFIRSRHHGSLREVAVGLAAAHLVLVEPIHCQQAVSQTTPTYWIGAGLGRSSLGWLAGSANATVHFDWALISVRVTANSEGLFGGDEFSDVAALVGIGARERVWSRSGQREMEVFASIALGIAWVRGSRHKPDPDPGLFDGTQVPVDGTLGLPLEAQLFWRGTAIGVGLYLFENLNPEQSFFGATLGVQVGRFR